MAHQLEGDLRMSPCELITSGSHKVTNIQVSLDFQIPTWFRQFLLSRAINLFCPLSQRTHPPKKTTLLAGVQPAIQRGHKIIFSVARQTSDLKDTLPHRDPPKSHLNLHLETDNSNGDTSKLCSAYPLKT